MQLLERLDTALAGRYQVQRELGRGGTATVYLAHDLRHGRDVALKVLHPELAVTVGTERFEREIRIAAALRHPHILPLLDSGEAAGHLYYVMPYVPGESLRALLRREGRLPIPVAARIAAQVADALEHAHAQGVVHRDVKPENILLDGRHALVVDFGIAYAIGTAALADRATLTGTVVGTPAYMSPEQASGERELDGRSDVYSLGCVLWEMLAGGAPFEGLSPQAVLVGHMVGELPPIEERREDVPPALAATLRRALTKFADERFATAGAFAEALQAELTPGVLAASPRRLRRRPRAIILGLTGTIVLAMAGAAVLMLRPAVGSADERPLPVLAADVRNTTGEAVFDRAIHAAFVAGLQQSDRVTFFPRTRVTQTLQRMGRAASDTVLDERLAREVAVREGLRAVLLLDISRIDDTYALVGRVIDPQSGVDLASRSARVAGRGGVLDALDELSRGLRRDLGESVRSVRGGLELDRATTSSLDALKLWTDAATAWRLGKRAESAQLLDQALALDSNFALALVDRGVHYFFANDRPAGERYFTRALALRDRLTPQERMRIEARVASWRDERDRAITLRRIYLATYPGDRAEWYNLATDLMRARRFPEALVAFDSLLTVDSLNFSAHVNRAVTLASLARFDESIASYRRAYALYPALATQDFNNHEYGNVLVRAGRVPEARANFERMLAGDATMQAKGLRSLALLDMWEGRFEPAIERLREATTLMQAAGARTSELRNRAFLASALLEVGRRDAARAEMRRVDSLFRVAYIEPVLLLHALRLHLRTGGERQARVLMDSLAARAGAQNTFDQAAVSIGRGELAFVEGRDADGLELMRLARRQHATGLTTLALADALLRTGDVAGAVALQGDLRNDVTGWEPQLGYSTLGYRIGRTYERRGDVPAALDAYRAFLAAWPEADPTIEAVRDAKARLVRLARLAPASAPTR